RDKDRKSTMPSVRALSPFRAGERAAGREAVPRTVDDEKTPALRGGPVGLRKRVGCVRVEDDRRGRARVLARDADDPTPVEEAPPGARLRVVLARQDDEQTKRCVRPGVARTRGRWHEVPGSVGAPRPS